MTERNFDAPAKTNPIEEVRAVSAVNQFFFYHIVYQLTIMWNTHAHTHTHLVQLTTGAWYFYMCCNLNGNRQTLRQNQSVEFELRRLRMVKMRFNFCSFLNLYQLLNKSKCWIFLIFSIYWYFADAWQILLLHSVKNFAKNIEISHNLCQVQKHFFLYKYYNLNVFFIAIKVSNYTEILSTVQWTL